uniref:Vacuolar ATPase assembly protein VMA22 n=1 Tax=Peronospora matthiolae TaxID=2874970 RepID=A0AAV1TTY4_9STRA
MVINVADVDNALVEGVESFEQYLEDQELSCDKLKKGFLLLTKARMLLPPHALSENSYHEEFEASSVVTLDSHGKWRVQDAMEGDRQKVDEKSEDVTVLRHRRARGSYQDEDRGREMSKKHTGSDSDTLLWFSSLPPSDLRQAKQQFSSGLQALLVAAASARNVQKAVRDVVTNSNELHR